MKKPVFDILVEELMIDADNARMLEESMSFDMDRIRKIPLRYRIIALGFVRGFSLEELNKKLLDAGAARLYARNLWEAGLIYAFLNRMPYTEWQNLQKICMDFRDSEMIEDTYFKTSGISMNELSRYVKDGSEEAQSGFATRHLTRLVEQRMETAGTGQDAFAAFLSDNADAFSPVREKTRYYFCKYLYYMLMSRVEQYIKTVGDGAPADDAFQELMVFKGITPLKRKKHTPREAWEFLMSCDLSCGEIFDAFNYFYFEYVSLDWMQVLLEYYGNVRDLPKSAREALAKHLRRYDSEYEKLDDDAAINKLYENMEKNEAALDDIYSLESEGRGYQRNRAGENTIRKYIKGTLDIDRTTLVCFLLFFADNAKLSQEDEISEDRLNQILVECGFPHLREDDDFDNFVLQYLSSSDRVGFLMEEVTNYAMSEENFYLYRVYQGSTSYSEDFLKLIK